MNDAQQFAVGAITLAATREVAMRAEVLTIGQTVRVLHKGKYGEGKKVSTGVIVGFEPFTNLPTIIVAYVDSEYGATEMKISAYNKDTAKDFEIIAAPSDSLLEIDRKKVVDLFASEERKLQASIDEVRAKRDYFERFFGDVIKGLPGAVPRPIEPLPACEVVNLEGEAKPLGEVLTPDEALSF